MSEVGAQVPSLATEVSMQASGKKQAAIYSIATNAIFTGASSIFLLCTPAQSQIQDKPAAPTTLHAFLDAAEGKPPAPWRVVGLPGNTSKPLTQFDIVQLGADRVPRVHADHSFANLTHALEPTTTPDHVMHWRWQLDQPVAGADLQTNDGDDMPIKVGALFDLPLDHLGFVDRSLLRLARSASGQHVPGAALCYVWDHKLAAGTELPNAFTNRIRYLVLDSANSPLHQWVSHVRDLNADFLRSFGTESDTVPPPLAILVGADADNTGESSLAYVGGVSLMEQ